MRNMRMALFVLAATLGFGTHAPPVVVGHYEGLFMAVY